MPVISRKRFPLVSETRMSLLGMTWLILFLGVGMLLPLICVEKMFDCTQTQNIIYQIIPKSLHSNSRGNLKNTKVLDNTFLITHM